MLSKYFENNQIWQIKEILPSQIPFSENVVKMCEANRCGKYGTCWTCPPGVGKLEDWKVKILSYKRAFVFTQKFDLEDSFDFEGMIKGQQQAKALLQQITNNLINDKIEHLALGCEGCEICKKCTYPDAPCRYPNKAIVSVEACGINVVDLAKNIGINYNNGVNTVTYFCIILFK